MTGIVLNLDVLKRCREKIVKHLTDAGVDSTEYAVVEGQDAHIQIRSEKNAILFRINNLLEGGMKGYVHVKLNSSTRSLNVNFLPLYNKVEKEPVQTTQA